MTYFGDSRGEVLIINNETFSEQATRLGSEKDASDLTSVFTQIGFNVENKKNLNKKEITDVLENFSKNIRLFFANICIVVIMSHGIQKFRDKKFLTEIICVDEERISVEDILKKFNNVNCPWMANKPKIFILQCCRNKLEKDGKEMLQADMLVAYATLPGMASFRDPDNGSIYIQGLCEVICENCKDLDFESLLKIVDENLSKKYDFQRSSFENRAFKLCYLNPL